MSPHCHGSHKRKPRLRLSRRPIVLVILAVTAGVLVRGAAAQQPGRGTRELLKLIPPDSGVVLAVDDLRGQARELFSSKLAAEFQELPAVKAWFASEKYEQLETARDQIEGMLQAKLTDIRDQVLGDAVVFAVRLPTPGAGPIDSSQASGLLVLKARDPALLKKLIDLINTIQQNNGELASIDDHKQGKTSYFVRKFPPGADRKADAYVNFPDGTFAISNSEEVIRQLIDRKAREGATDAAPGVAGKFDALACRLPERALARLFVDARFAENLLEKAPGDRSRGRALLERYVAAHEFAGAALVVCEEHPALKIAEVFQPDRFREFLGSWKLRALPTAQELDRLPATTLLVGSLRMDFQWLLQTVRGALSDREKKIAANVEAVAQGLLLGQDLQTRILPVLGPRVIILADAPADLEPKTEASPPTAGKWPFPTVIALEFGSRAETKPSAGSNAPPRATVADALDNALNTLLALITLDQKKKQGDARIVSREVAGVTVKTLEPPIQFAYAVDRPGHRLVLGTSAAVVARYLAAGAGPASGERFRRLRARGFADAQSFLCLDLAAVARWIVARHDRLIERIAAGRKRDRQDDPSSARRHP